MTECVLKKVRRAPTYGMCLLAEVRLCNGEPRRLFLFLFLKDGKTKVKVIAGESLGAKAVIDTRTPIMFLDIHVQAGGTFVQEIPKEYNGFAYVWRGAGSFTEDRHSVEMGKVRKPFYKPYSGKGQSKGKSVLFIHCNCLLSRCVVKKMGAKDNRQFLRT